MERIYIFLLDYIKWSPTIGHFKVQESSFRYLSREAGSLYQDDQSEPAGVFRTWNVLLIYPPLDLWLTPLLLQNFFLSQAAKSSITLCQKDLHDPESSTLTNLDYLLHTEQSKSPIKTSEYQLDKADRPCRQVGPQNASSSQSYAPLQRG